MASARAKVDYGDIDAVYVTMKFDNTITWSASEVNGSASVGLAVTVISDDTVALTADAQTVYGKLIFVGSDGYCTVQIDGFMLLPKGNAVTLTAGSKICGALGAASAKGYIRNIAAATLAEVAIVYATLTS